MAWLGGTAKFQYGLCLSAVFSRAVGFGFRHLLFSAMRRCDCQAVINGASRGMHHSDTLGVQLFTNFNAQGFCTCLRNVKGPANRGIKINGTTALPI